MAETLRDPGCVEVGYADDDRRWTISLEERKADDGRPGLTLTRSTVFVVTGAAGGIMSAIVADLARPAAGGDFYLLDLTPEPDPSDPDLDRAHPPRTARASSSPSSRRHKAKGEKVTPVAVERQILAIERRRRGAGGPRGGGGGGRHRRSTTASTWAMSPPWRAVMGDGAAALRPDRRAGARRRHRDQPDSWPRRSQASSTSCSTSRATAGSAC